MENCVRRVDWIVERRQRSGGGRVPSGGTNARVDARSRGLAGGGDAGAG